MKQTTHFHHLQHNHRHHPKPAISNSHHRQSCVTAIEPSDYHGAGILDCSPYVPHDLMQPVRFLWIVLENQKIKVAWIFGVRLNGSKTLFEAMFGFGFDETVNDGEWVDRLT